jgi:hypothetical protein
VEHFFVEQAQQKKGTEGGTALQIVKIKFGKIYLFFCQIFENQRQLVYLQQ